MKKITKIGVNETLIQKKKLKVAAYCRVSTASDEQLISLEAQRPIMKITSVPMTNGSMWVFTMTKESRVQKRMSVPDFFL